MLFPTLLYGVAGPQNAEQDFGPMVAPEGEEETEAENNDAEDKTEATKDNMNTHRSYPEEKGWSGK